MHLVAPSMRCLRELVAGNLPAARSECGLSFGTRLWPDDFEMREGLAVHLSSCEHSPRDRYWRVYMIADDDDSAIGHAGFKGGPSRFGEVEMYWCVEPRYRRRGIAQSAAQSLADFAFAQTAVRAIIATIAGHNVASQKVALAVGMRQVENELRHGLPLWRLPRDAWQPLAAGGPGATRMSIAAPAADELGRVS